MFGKALAEAEQMLRDASAQGMVTGAGTAPHRPDEAVAVLSPERGSWTFWAPGMPGWATLPAADGAQVLDAVVKNPRAATYTVYRAVRSGDTGQGITPIVQGTKGQPISSRAAVALRRFSALRVGPAMASGTIARNGGPVAAEAPILLQPTVEEVQAVPPTGPAPVLDAEPVTEQEAPKVPGETPADETTMQQAAAAGGGGLWTLLKWGGLAAAAYYAAKKMGWIK